MNIKVPVSWLREYLKTDVSAKTLANLLSLSGPSVEKVEKRQEDYLFDIEISGNRPDLLSIFGIAREAHAICAGQNLKSNLSLPKGLNLNLQPETSKLLTLNVIIKNQNLCPRFTAVIIDNIKIKPSPAIIKNRLEASGIRSINNIVDISNYLMLELGQPMHVFDYDKIKGAKMILRKSQAGEKIKTLDDITRNLPQGAIVIEDLARLIDLCGIMGGANSSVSKRTKRVVIFVQAYNPLLIRKTTQALSLRTEAAIRFEKGIDLEAIMPALSRAVYLAKQTSGARIASEIIDIYPQKPRTKTIKLNFQKLDRYLGINIEAIQAVKILKSLGFDTWQSSDQLIAKPPTWRTQDMEYDVDLIEEIARIYGYHNLPASLPTGQTPKTTESELKNVIELKKALQYLGLCEVMTYSLIPEKLLRIAGKNDKNSLVLTNPLSEEWQFLRPTLIPSLLDVISKNQHIEKKLSIFEIAKTYQIQKNNLPRQDLELAITLPGTNFPKIKGITENVLDILKRKAKFQELAASHPFFDSNQSAQIKIGEDLCGIVGVIKQSVVDKFDFIQETKISATQLNLTSIYQQPQIKPFYKAIPKYPPVIEDISLIVAQVLFVEEIIDAIKKYGSPLVKKIEVVDIFEDPKLGENKKSVTLRLTFQKSSGTPTITEANEVKAKIISYLEKIFRAKIRK